MSRWRTLGIQVFPDGAPVDSQSPLDCSKRYPLAPGFLNRLPSLPLEEIGLRAEVAAGWSALATPSVIIPWPFSSSDFDSSGSRIADQCSPRPLATDGRTGAVGERPWPLRRNTGLGGASWVVIMRPSCRTDSRPYSPCTLTGAFGCPHPSVFGQAFRPTLPRSRMRLRIKSTCVGCPHDTDCFRPPAGRR